MAISRVPVPLTHPGFVPAKAVGIMQSIIETEVAKYGDVGLHSERVAQTAFSFGEHLGMAADQLDILRFGARLHDVGKLVIDPNILNKKGRLTELERAEMEKHASYGAQILSIIPDLDREIIEIAQFHHERYDGHGYDNLMGEAIPYKARIVQIADVHDALCASRVYKDGMPEVEALKIMSADEASPKFGRRNFDPVLLRSFVAFRLADPSFTADREDRQVLRFFSVSDPVLDLPEVLQEAGIIEFGDAGERRLFEFVGGKPSLVRQIDLDGTQTDYQTAPSLQARVA